MMQSTHDLTRGRVSAGLLRFYFPMLLTNILQQAYTFADTIILGKGLGDQALGSVGNLSSMMLLTTGFLMGISNGFAVNIAQSVGAGNDGLLRKNIAHSIRLCSSIAVALTVVTLILLGPLLGFMQTAPSLLRDSLLYGYIFFGGLIVTAAYNLCACILRALGDSRTPFRAIILASAVNIALDCLFIFVFHMDVAGAAVATVAAQMISVLACRHKLRQHAKLRLTRDDFMKDPAISLSLLRNGFPAALANAVTAVGCMVVQGYVNASGAAYTSAYSACSRYLNLIMLPSLTAGFSLSTFVSQNKGAGNVQRIRKGVRVGIRIALVSWLIIGVPMRLIPEQLAGVMLNETETIALTADFLRICSVSLLFLNLLFIFRSAVQGMGRPLIPMLSGVAEMALRIPVIIFMVKSVGFGATAYAESLAWTGALALNAVAYIVFIRQPEAPSAAATAPTEQPRTSGRNRGKGQTP